MSRSKTFLGIGVLAFVIGLALLGWARTDRQLNLAEASLAIFTVDNLSCGSCVRNIEDALSGVAGIGAVEVSVTAGRSEVEYDRQQIDAAAIAQRISSAGYPATVRETLTAAEYRALQEEQTQLGGQYVARIGKRLLPRVEFEAALARHQLGLSQPLTPEALQQLRQQVWDKLQQRELLLNAAEGANVVVPDAEVVLTVEKYKSGHGDIERWITERFGSLELFTRQIKNDLIIRRHLEQNVASSELPPEQRQQQLDRWYRQLVEETPVVIFDPTLKTADKGSGCGGSCCG